MKKIQTEIVLNASATDVWNALTELTSFKNWNPFIIESEGEVTEGNRIRNVMKNGEKDLTFKPTIQKVEEGKYFSWLGSLFFRGLFDGYHYFELKPQGKNQTLLIHGENFSGILSGFLLKQIGESTRENFVRMNEALKAHVEQ